jgi:hypothetical protein
LFDGVPFLCAVWIQVIFGGFNGQRSVNDLWKFCPKSGIVKELGGSSWESVVEREWRLVQSESEAASHGIEIRPSARHFR